MNILVTTAYPPVLGMHGGGVRMYHNIRILSSRHSVQVLTFVGSDEERDAVSAVRDICDSVTAIRRIPDFRPHWLSLDPFLMREFSTPEMHRAVDHALSQQKIGAIQCEYLQMAQFRRPGIFSVLTLHEALSHNAWDAYTAAVAPVERLRLFYRWMQLLRYEVGETRRFNRVVTMTGEDARYFQSYSPAASIRAIPIGVDIEEFAPFACDWSQPVTALFVGNFRHSPNLEAARFIIRELAPRFRETTFVIAGTHAPGDLEPGANVLVAGYVADTRELYRRPNTLVIAPLFSGTGQRVKLLEAMSMACPVISTPLGVQGFPVQDGAEVMIAGDVAGFESALRTLIAQPARRNELGEAARRLIIREFGWERLAGDFLNVVEEASVSH